MLGSFEPMSYSESIKKCPVTWAKLWEPKPLPPLFSIKIKQCMDPSVRLPSTWRDAIGPILTDRRIKEYQSRGLLGGHPDLLLPKATGPRCLSCNSPSNVKHRSLSYLPRDGWYCELCVANARTKRDREKNESRAVQQRRRSYE